LIVSAGSRKSATTLASATSTCASRKWRAGASGSLNSRSGNEGPEGSGGWKSVWTVVEYFLHYCGHESNHGQPSPGRDGGGVQVQAVGAVRLAWSNRPRRGGR